MDINWFELAYKVIGGLGVFLFGMRSLSESLQALASDFLRKVIGWLTANRFLAVTVGLPVTMIIQSSSVTTVMVVGFVNAGLMSLAQAIGVVLGANIGTTITGWIIALKIGKYGLLFIALGLVPFFFLKSYKWRNIGKIAIALGFIFLGLQFMSGGFKVLTKAPDFAAALTMFAAKSYPSVLACVGVGCVLTFIVQSSSAMLGITIALATSAEPGQQPVIGLATAVALVLGENIGTTVTAQLASIGGNINAKRTADVHTIFNVLGVVVMTLIFQPYMVFIENVIGPSFDSLGALFKNMGSGEHAVIGFQIAAAHSIFNVINVLLFLPFVDQLAKLATRLRKDKGKPKQNLKLLGPIVRISPELALKQADGQVRLLGSVTDDMLCKTQAYVKLNHDDAEQLTAIDHSEDVTDNMQQEVTIFLTTLLQMSISRPQATRGYSLIRISDEIESVGDYAKRLAHYKQRLLREEKSLSEAACEELDSLMTGTLELFRKALAYTSDEGQLTVEELAEEAELLRQQADNIRTAHLERVTAGTCEPLAGLTFSDMIVSLRRIKNHTVNMLEAKESRWDDHLEEVASLILPADDSSARLSTRPPKKAAGSDKSPAKSEED